MSFLLNMRLHLHMYTQQSPHHIWVFASIWDSRLLCRPWRSLTNSCLLIGFFLHQYVVHGPFVRHPWKPTVNLAYSSTKIGLHFYVHRNLGHTFFFPSLIACISNTILLGLSPKSFLCDHYGSSLCDVYICVGSMYIYLVPTLTPKTLWKPYHFVAPPWILIPAVREIRLWRDFN